MDTRGSHKVTRLLEIASYLTDTGVADAYAVAFTPAITTYTNGLRVKFLAANSNTGPSTLAVNGLVAKSIRKSVSTNLSAGDILAGQIIEVTYDGTNFQMLSGSGGGGGTSGYSGFSGASAQSSGYSGYSGLSGQSGYSGYSGVGTSGFSGYSGNSTSGYSGYSGNSTSGYSGFSGPQGTVGQSGYSGYSGNSTSGYSGYSGNSTSGYSGYSGNSTSGYSGYSGNSTSGYSGYSGPQGVAGSDGTSGYSGYSGLGTSGYSGFSGNSTSGYSGYSGNSTSGYSGYSGPAGSAGSPGSDGMSGYSGLSGYSGYSGPAGSNGVSGYSGYSGVSGYSGYSGPAGSNGTSGFSGYSGPVGSNGTSGFSGYSGFEAGLDFTYSASTVMSDPGSGGFKLNSNTAESVTQMAIDDLNYFTNTDVSAYIISFDDSTNTPKGYLEIAEPISKSVYLYSISSLTDNVGWTQIALTHISGTGSLVAYSGRIFVIRFYRAGDSGYSGYSGFSGVGTSGFSGYSGFSGASAQSSGYSGFSGLSGYSGYSGPAGQNGTSGFSGFSGVGAATPNRFFIEIMQGERLTTGRVLSETVLSKRPILTPFWVDGTGLQPSTIRYMISGGASSNRAFVGSLSVALYSAANETQLSLFGTASQAFNFSATSQSSAWNGPRLLDFTGMTGTMTNEGRWAVALYISMSQNNTSFASAAIYGGDTFPNLSGFLIGGTSSATAATSLAFPFWGVYSATTNSWPNSIALSEVQGGNSASLIDPWVVIKEI